MGLFEIEIPGRTFPKTLDPFVNVVHSQVRVYQEHITHCPLEIATGRKPLDFTDIENMDIYQLDTNIDESTRRDMILQKIAMDSHLKARQALDIRKDLAMRLDSSDGPYEKR